MLWYASYTSWYLDILHIFLGVLWLSIHPCFFWCWSFRTWKCPQWNCYATPVPLAICPHLLALQPACRRGTWSHEPSVWSDHKQGQTSLRLAESGHKGGCGTIKIPSLDVASNYTPAEYVYIYIQYRHYRNRIKQICLKNIIPSAVIYHWLGRFYRLKAWRQAVARLMAMHTTGTKFRISVMPPCLGTQGCYVISPSAPDIS